MSRKGRVVVLTVAAAVVAGCGRTPHPARVDRSAFRENIATWSLPLDDYLVDQRDIGYAGSLVHADCMRAEGFDEPVVNPADYLGGNINKVMRKVFNLDLATRYGYHGPPPKLPPPTKTKLSPAQAAADAACSQQVREELREDAADLTSLVEGFAGTAYDAAKADSKVVAAIGRWRSCMLPLGISDLPNNPEVMPSDSQAKRFHWRTASDGAELSDAPPAITRPGPEEIRAATFDAKCRESSGYSKIFYKTEVEKQFDLMDKNQDALERALQAKERSAAAVRKVLQRHGA